MIVRLCQKHVSPIYSYIVSGPVWPHSIQELPQTQYFISIFKMTTCLLFCSQSFCGYVHADGQDDAAYGRHQEGNALHTTTDNGRSKWNWFICMNNCQTFHIRCTLVGNKRWILKLHFADNIFKLNLSVKIILFWFLMVQLTIC